MKRTTSTTLGAALLLSFAGFAAAAQTPVSTTPLAVVDDRVPPVTVETTPVEVEGVKVPGLKSEDRIVCRSIRYTGSRFPVRVCETRGETAKKIDTQRRAAEKLTERLNTRIGRAGAPQGMTGTGR